MMLKAVAPSTTPSSEESNKNTSDCLDKYWSEPNVSGFLTEQESIFKSEHPLDSSQFDPAEQMERVEPVLPPSEVRDVTTPHSDDTKSEQPMKSDEQTSNPASPHHYTQRAASSSPHEVTILHTTHSSGTMDSDRVLTPDQSNSKKLGELNLESNDAMSSNRKSLITSPLSTPSRILQDRFPKGCRDFVNSSYRGSADLRRWRLTNTDRLNSLIDECERQINGRKLYVCKFCGKIYEIKSSMRYHMKIIHLQMHLRTTEMQCRICGKQFTCVSAVNRHQVKCNQANSSTDSSTHRSRNNPSMIHQTSLFGVQSPTRQTAQSSSVHIDPGACGVGLRNDPITTSPISTVFQPSAINHATNRSAFTNQSNTTPYSTNNSLLPYVPDALIHPMTSERTGTSPRLLPDMMNHNGDLVDPRNDPSSTWWSGGFGALNPSNVGSNNCTSNSSADLTSLQLEMCMKAVVQGLHSNLNPMTLANPMNQLSQYCADKSGTIDALANRTTSMDDKRGSFSSARTPSDSSDAEGSFSYTESGEVAMDLSSRPHRESLMVETF